MDKGDLKGISLFVYLAYVVYKNIQPHVEKRSTYAHFTRLEVEYRLIIDMIILINLQIYTRVKQDNKKFENKRESNIDF